MKFIIRSFQGVEMFSALTFSRLFHTSHLDLSSSKMLLSELRKKTGYTFANCKKALEVNQNDLVKAEEWLKKEAQAMGWAKVAKVAGRSTLQGLIGVASDKQYAAMIEINCETDFVARNKLFQEMTATVLGSCFAVAKENKQNISGICKTYLNTDQLGALLSPHGKTLNDEVALLVAQIGENVKLRRGTCISVDENYLVAGYTHPTPPNSSITSLTGKYGALLVYKTTENRDTAELSKTTENQDNSDIAELSKTTENRDNRDTAELSKQLCQHIIGMNPAEIGDAEKDQAKENKDDETCMIFQEFLMEPDIPVSQVLNDFGITLVDFVRYQCGEEIVSPKIDETANIEVGG